MARSSLAGTRIRERRLALGLRQAAVAKQAGVSASYLNLIEHNRRRIGGKLLVSLARILDSDAAMLAEGAHPQVLGALQIALGNQTDASLDGDSIVDFADRNPQWAAVIATQQTQIAGLEQTVATLSDRLSHDPFLSESLHEILSTAAAIRSTASILAEPGEMDQNWQRRFQANVFEDSKRLADASQALMGYLGQGATPDTTARSPWEEVEEVLNRCGHHISELEQANPNIASIATAYLGSLSNSAQVLGQSVFDKYLQDANALPLDQIKGLLSTHGLSPGHVAEATGQPLGRVLRRLAQMPHSPDLPEMGLVVSDASGSLLYKKSCPGFAIPRVGAACALWPLFQAGRQVSLPIQQIIQHTGQPGDVAAQSTSPTLASIAIAEVLPNADLTSPPNVHSTMLVFPVSNPQIDTDATQIGTSCRICPRKSCAARCEPSVLSDGF